jgi:hypothetical protein
MFFPLGEQQSIKPEAAVMGAPKTTCPDCGTELQPIKLVDATERVLGKVHFVSTSHTPLKMPKLR